MAIICIFGASTTYGAWDEEAGGWVGRLRRHLDKRSHDFIVYNCGISGNTSADVAKRIEAECKTRFQEAKEYNETTAVLISIGANDSYWLHKKGSNKVSLRNYGENLRRILKIAKKHAPSVAFVGFYPIDESKTSPIPWNKNITYKANYILSYAAVAKKVCRQMKVPYIDIYERWIKKDWKGFLSDGLHPNSKGHEDIFRAVLKLLKKKKIA